MAYVLSAGAVQCSSKVAVAEIATAVAVGLAVGLIRITIGQAQISPRLFELTAAAAAAIIANVTYLSVDEFAEWIPLAAGLIILLPGLALLDSVEKLAHGHLASGGARLAGVGVVLLAMTFGSILGLTIVAGDAYEPPVSGNHAGRALVGCAGVVVVAVGSTIRFRATRRDLPVALVGSGVALLGAE